MSAQRQKTDAPWIVDRRVFMGTVAAASAVTLLPLAAGAAMPQLPSDATRALLTDWHIDDQWGVYPRYADTIPYTCPATDDAI